MASVKCRARHISAAFPSVSLDEGLGAGFSHNKSWDELRGNQLWLGSAGDAEISIT